MSEKRQTQLFINSMNDEILANYSKTKDKTFKLQDFILEPVTDVKDFLNYLQICTCQYYRLTFRCHEKSEKEGPQISVEELPDQTDLCKMQVKFFIKQRPRVTIDDPRRNAYHKENNLYCSLLPLMLEFYKQQWCPLTYLCRSDVLVLQDLKELNYSNVCDRESFNRWEMFQVLQSLATMHACSLVYEHHNRSLINETYGYCLEEVLIAKDVPWFRAGVKALVDVAKHHPNYTDSRHVEFIQNDLVHHLYSICSMVQQSKKYRNVLCHGSPWIGNVLLNDENLEAPAIFVDFQTSRYCPPAIDVIFAMSMNLTKEDKVNYENTFLKFYYESILKCLDYNSLCAEALGISEKQFLESYKEFQLFGLVCRALSDTILKISPPYITDHYKYTNRSTGVLDYMEKNEKFRSIMLDNVQDILDYLITIHLDK